MAKCWIIEQGEYSDYRVVGIFTTLKNAEIALNYLKSDDDLWSEPSIEERELDPLIAELNAGLRQFLVRFLATGYNVALKWEIGSNRDDVHWNAGSAYTVWATNESHAVKIAAERHAQYLARQRKPA